MTDAGSTGDQIFTDHRRLLIAVAYRVLGSVTDAEDAVQDAWLRWRGVEVDEIRDPRGFLVKVVTRLAIDRLRRRIAARETYVGEWLPEPLPTGSPPGDDVGRQVELAEELSTALMLVLETLSPLERAVFVLREAFGFSHAEIAEILDRSETAVRQLAHRARDHVAERRPRFPVDRAMSGELAQRFMAATTYGDLDGLMAMLAPGVSLVADGGGKVRAPLLPVSGADKVARFFVVAAARELPDPAWRVIELNGSAGIVITSEGRPITAATFELVDGRVSTIYLVANPDKLQAFALDS